MTVCVQYPESATNSLADQHELFVIPTDRTLTVTTTTPDTVGPGAEVKLGLQVNREEEVDLVVSVFDESLLGVSGDLSGNIRNFFLADARGQGRAARDLAATRLGNVSIAELVAKGEKMLKDKEALAREPGLGPQLTSLVQQWKDEGKLMWGGRGHAGAPRGVRGVPRRLPPRLCRRLESPQNVAARRSVPPRLCGR